MAIPMVALSVVVMAYSGIMGPLGILLLYALWFPLMVKKGWAAARPPAASGFALAYLALCCASVAWSDFPAVTLRAAFELATMVCCSFIIVNTVRPGAYLKGLILGIDLVLAASLIDGNRGTDAFGGKPALVGLFGSKNQLGFFAELAVFLAIALAVAKEHSRTRLFYALPTLLMGFACLLLSYSASSIASLGITLMVLAAIRAVSGLSLRLRTGLTVGAAVTVPLLVAIGAAFGLQGQILELFGKDATLTGRTYLWGQGYSLGMQHPGLGVGYAAFWVPGRPEAERFWYEFYIASRSGFHFHDTYVEIFVELGIAGFLLLLSWIVTALFRSVRVVTRHGPQSDRMIGVGIMVMLLIRSLVEVDILGPFGMGLFLLLPVLARLAASIAKAPDASQSPAGA